MTEASKKQIGGDHYIERSIQPWDIWCVYEDLGPFRLTAVKYILRSNDHIDGSIENIKKAIHTLEKFIEIEEHVDAHIKYVKQSVIDNELRASVYDALYHCERCEEGFETPRQLNSHVQIVHLK